MFEFLKMMGKKKKVTLVLGGGSARGIAHIGVLKVLEREKIPIDMIVGTSIGSLIGAGYSTGITVQDMEKKASAFSWEKLFDLTFPRLALIEGKKMDEAISDIMQGMEFKDAKIPLYIVTTDIETNEEIIFSSGDLKKAIRASCSWPGIFNPVEIDGRMLVDGGVKNSVPTDIAKRLGADFIIASDVGFCVKNGRIENILQMLLQTFQIMGEELNKYQDRLADVLIKPRLGDIDQASFHRSVEAIKMGEEETGAKVAEIKKKLGI